MIKKTVLNEHRMQETTNQLPAEGLQKFLKTHPVKTTIIEAKPKTTIEKPSTALGNPIVQSYYIQTRKQAKIAAAGKKKLT